MRVQVDRELCEGYAFCERNAPDHFRVDDEGVMEIVSSVVSESRRAAVEGAVRSCPKAALTVVDN